MKFYQKWTLVILVIQLMKMKKDNFLDDFVSNPNPSYYICNKEELEIRNVQIN